MWLQALLQSIVNRQIWLTPVPLKPYKDKAWRRYSLHKALHLFCLSFDSTEWKFTTNPLIANMSAKPVIKLWETKWVQEPGQNLLSVSLSHLYTVPAQIHHNLLQLVVGHREDMQLSEHLPNKSNQIKSNQIKSNQIKSNQIKSKSDLFLRA